MDAFSLLFEYMCMYSPEEENSVERFRCAHRNNAGQLDAQLLWSVGRSVLLLLLLLLLLCFCAT